ncbi:MAG: EAL domain-containing protein [Lachnospiraceae bacterium]|nr:EAL domain-containing protein [Lachnospiraceae bacterium]
MILYYDACAIIIISLVVISCVLKRMFHGRTNGLFYILLGMMMASAFADLCQAHMQNYSAHTETNRILQCMWQYIYFGTHNLILPVYMPFVYSNIGIWHEFKQNRKVKGLWLGGIIINAAVLLSNIIYPWVFYITPDIEYQRRPGIVIFYIVAVFYMIYEIGVLYKYRNIIKRDKLIVMVLLFPISALGIGIQAMFPSHLVEMFMISIAILLFSFIIWREEETLDPVTGAKKYSSAHEHIKKAIATGTPNYILLVKIVNYMNIRLYLGQELLNEFLREQSGLMRQVARQTSLGEDLYYLEDGLFGFISDSCDYETMKLFAQKIRDHFLDILMVKNFSVLADARLCILGCPEDIDNFNTLYTFCSSFHTIMPETRDVMHYPDYVDDRDFKIKSELDDIIDRAIKSRSFEMYYQPIYSITEKRFVAAEAFVRMRDETYGMISPGLFISAAEISGAIHAIGDYILDDVCRFISMNDFIGLGLSCIEVNMSTSQCLEMNLVEKVGRLLKRYNLDPAMLSLEITESAVDFDPDIVDQNINRLSEMGIRFSLDDYGTGYSNVKRVTSLPVEIVKLDKTFVDGVDDPQMCIMVQETIKMLKQMGKKVLVEGVEEEKVVQKFTDLGADYIQGCEYLQGYYFCRPLPERSFIEFMQKQVLN